VTLSELVEGHRFVSINATLVTDDLSADRTLDIEVTARNSFLLGVTNVRTDNPPKETFHVAFSKGSNRSSLFPIGHFRVDGVEAVQVRVSLQSDFKNVTGVDFLWYFANPSADKYARSTKLLLSFLVGYMLVLFAFYLRFDSESFTQVYLLILGVTGVFASNPVTYFFPGVPGAKVSDHILIALFLAAYKMFLVLEFEMLRSHDPRPKTIFVVLLGVAFAFYATVDAAAGYDRQSHLDGSEDEAPVIMQTETVLACFHAGYSLFVAVYALVAFVSNDGANTRRVAYFAFSAALTVLVVLFSGVYCVYADFWMYTVKPPLLMQSIISTLAALTLFFLHTGGGPEYVGLDKLKETDQTVIEIDQISADGDDVRDEEEDDNEEEEEEEE
jgi:hypothetical protein